MRQPSSCTFSRQCKARWLACQPQRHPLSGSSGYKHLFIYSWIELPDGQKHLLYRPPPPLTFRRLGAMLQTPSAITSDRGPQFTSALWAALCRLRGINLIPATSNHPQSNGLVERFHRRLKDALQARASGHCLRIFPG
jgi:hypothetical protein